ncbi:MAG: TonB family protein [Gemmatimonadetes bacterium]|nr:TonB family protein [Gemmatimonadota bacterium]
MTNHRATPSWCVIAALLSASALAAQQPPPVPLPMPAADSARHDSLPAVLTGRVIDSTGIGLANAEIMLSHADRVSAITTDSGVFRIVGLQPGTNVFNVRRIGYEAATFTAVLKPGKTHRATFTLSATAHALAAVSVSDTAVQTHWLDQFDRRRTSNRGTFITRADIIRKGARTGTDIVRTVPGIRIVPTRRGGGNQVLMIRGSGAGQCVPTMFYHNTPYSGTLDDFIADDVEAIEVYVGVSEIPAELDKNGRGICGAIVVWTRDPRRAP